MTIIPRRTTTRVCSAWQAAEAGLPGRAGRLLLALAVAGGWAGQVTAATLALTGFEAPEVILGIAPLSASWDSGDLLVARIDEQGAVGGFTGKKNAVVIPAIRAFGETITPALRADTRLGARLSSDVDLYAGAQLFATASSGGYSTPVSSFLAPTLTAPDAVRAGEFFQWQGSTGLGTDSSFGLSLPSLTTGLDVVAGGTASFKLETAVPFVLPYSAQTTTLNLGDRSATVFEVGVDFARGQDPGYVPVLEVLGANIAPPVPEFDEIRVKLPPFNPLANFGEVAVVDPAVSRVLDTRRSTGSTAITTYSGDLFRAAMDLDGILTFAVTAAATGTGVSYSGLETSIPGLGRAFYDILDVKYGVEVGYRESSVVDARLGATLDFFVAGTDTPIDVLSRTADGALIASTLRVEDWSVLPDLALLSTQDVDVRVQFTDLERTLTRTLDLILDDYMEIKAWQIGIDLADNINRAGLKDPILGPLAHLKLELAEELSIGLLHDTVGQLRDSFDATSWAPTLFTLRARQVVDSVLTDANAGLTSANLRRLDNGLNPASLAATRVVIATAPAGTQSPADVEAVDFSDPGQQRTVITRINSSGLGLPNYRRDYDGIADPFTTTPVAGLAVVDGSTYTLGTNAARIFELTSLENDGLIVGNGYLGFLAPGANDDGVLLISGSGTLRFNNAAELEGGIISNGAGHTIEYNPGGNWRSNFNPSVPSVPPFSPTIVRTFLTSDPAYYEQELNHGERIRTRSLIAHIQFNNEGTLIFNRSLVNPDILELRNAETGLISVRDTSPVRFDHGIVGHTVVDNAGTIESLSNATLTFDTQRITGGLTEPGLFRAATGGKLIFEGSSDLALLQHVDFAVGAGSLLDFRRAITTTANTTARFFIDTGGTMLLNGLSSATGRFVVENDGLLDVAAGNVSFVISGAGNATLSTQVAPIDLHNRGTVRVRQGAQLIFDVDIVNYASGGATLSEGSWELLGANVRTSNLANPEDALSRPGFRIFKPEFAVMQMNVSEVFGKATDFADLVFGEIFDPDTGELLLSNRISGLDTSLVNNAANVTLSGAAHFAYFNTVQANLGTLNLLDQHQFHTVGSYANRGGVTRVESGAGLHVNGALLIDGGSVHIGSDSELSIAGSLVDRGDGSLERRDIEVIGGSLDIAAGAKVTGRLVGFSRPDGLTLGANRSWIVRERVAEAQDGTEIVTPGVLSLRLRTGFVGTTQEGIGPGGVVQNDAHVVFDGEAARFDAFEQSLVDQRGTLVLRNGKSFNSPNSFFHNSGTLLLEGAQFALTGDGNEFLNEGVLGIDAASYFTVDFFNQNGGSLRLDGALDTGHLRIADVATVSGAGLLRADLIEIDGAGVFDLAGGTLIADELRGSLNLESGVFAAFAGTGRAAVSGDYRQSATALLEIDWSETAADLLDIAGTATLAGGLRLNLVDGFVPEVGRSLEILRAGELDGDFDPQAMFFAVGSGRQFAVRYETRAVFVDVMAAPVPLPPALPLSAGALALLMLYRRRPADQDARDTAGSPRLRAKASASISGGSDASARRIIALPRACRPDASNHCPRR